MRRLLRSLFTLTNPDGTQNPSGEECYNNFMKLEAAGLEFEEDEEKLVRYIRAWPWESQRHWGSPDQDVTRVWDAPTFATLHDYFNEKDEIEVVTLLDELKGTQSYIRTNYASCISEEQRVQSVKAFNSACRMSQNIADHGMMIGREHLKGVDAAAKYLASKIQAIVDKQAVDGFHAQDVSKMLSLPDEPIRYVLPHFKFSEGRPNAIVAWAGLSKTFLMMELAIAVAAGLPTVWGGLSVGLRGSVVIADYEMGEKINRRRLRRILFGLGVKPEQLGDRLAISSLPSITLTSPNAEQAYAKLCTGKALCLIDSFRAATPGGKDENSSEMANYLNILSRVSNATGCIFVLIHHQRKDGADQKPDQDPTQKMRGSSALPAALGASVSITKGSDGVYTITQGKVSSGQAGKPIHYRLMDVGDHVPLHDDSEGIKIVAVDRVAEADTEAQDLRRIVLDTIKSQRPDSREALQVQLRSIDRKIGNDRLKAIIDDLESTGHVTKQKGGGFRAVAFEDLL